MKKKNPPSRLKKTIEVDGVKILKGAILADQAKQANNNSYFPPTHYVDQKFTCEDCGEKEIWTAESQWRYFEVWKKPIYGQAVRCQSCRKKNQRERIENKKRTIEGLKKKAPTNRIR
jgi:predicted RNA-binding Zn-ribbon protein involved in translation (DUF1610 family)